MARILFSLVSFALIPCLVGDPALGTSLPWRVYAQTGQNADNLCLQAISPALTSVRNNQPFADVVFVWSRSVSWVLRLHKEKVQNWIQPQFVGSLFFASFALVELVIVRPTTGEHALSRGYLVDQISLLFNSAMALITLGPDGPGLKELKDLCRWILKSRSSERKFGIAVSSWLKHRSVPFDPVWFVKLVGVIKIEIEHYGNENTSNEKRRTAQRKITALKRTQSVVNRFLKSHNPSFLGYQISRADRVQLAASLLHPLKTSKIFLVEHEGGGYIKLFPQHYWEAISGSRSPLLNPPVEIQLSTNGKFTIPEQLKSRAFGGSEQIVIVGVGDYIEIHPLDRFDIRKLVPPMLLGSDIALPKFRAQGRFITEVDPKGRIHLKRLYDAVPQEDIDRDNSGSALGHKALIFLVDKDSVRIYSSFVWSQLAALNEPDTASSAIYFRNLYGNAFKGKIDSEGRILIPDEIRERIGLSPGGWASIESSGDYSINVSPALNNDTRAHRGPGLSTSKRSASSSSSAVISSLLLGLTALLFNLHLWGERIPQINHLTVFKPGPRKLAFAA